MTKQRIQFLDELGAEFARVAEQEEASHRSLRRPTQRPRTGPGGRVVAIALTFVLLLGGTVYAVPTTRSALDDVTSSFIDWVAGNHEQAPGRVLRPNDDVPSWFREGGDTRLIAKTAGVGLYVTRAETDAGLQLKFGLGEGAPVIQAGSIEDWRDRFEEHAVVVLGPALFGPQDVVDERGRFPLLGVTARSVDRIELRYTAGPPLRAAGLDGGFVLIADAWRPLRELVAYDAAGRELERADVRHLDMRYLCEKEPTCPSGNGAPVQPR